MLELNELPLVFILEPDRSAIETYTQSAGRLRLSLKVFEQSEQFLTEVLNQRPALWIFPVDLCRACIERQTELTRQGNYSSAIGTASQSDLTYVIRVMEQGAVTVMEKPLERFVVERALQMALHRTSQERETQKIYHEFSIRKQSLTDRQQAVLAGVVTGKPTKSIAAELNVSVRSVEFERAKLNSAFQVESSAQLAQLYGEFRILQHLRSGGVPEPHSSLRRSATSIAKSSPDKP